MQKTFEKISQHKTYETHRHKHTKHMQKHLTIIHTHMKNHANKKHTTIIQQHMKIIQKHKNITHTHTNICKKNIRKTFTNI